MGFDLNAGLFPQAQLYDQHVPLSMPNKQQPQLNFNKKNTRPQNRNDNKQYKGNQRNNINRPANAAANKAISNAANGDAAAKKKEEMDDLAMLGINASDVGSGMWVTDITEVHHNDCIVGICLHK